MNYQLHPVRWTLEHVKRFWDYAAQAPAYQDEYFAKQVGAGIVRFLRSRSLCRGRVLDYGCGPGHLLQWLLRTGSRCEGADFSPTAVAHVNEWFASEPNWGGARCVDGPLPWPDEAFDLVVCLETIEHVLDDALPALLGQLRRVLSPRGRLFITTPCDEDLSRSAMACPECGAVFHRFQHVRRLTAAELAGLLARHGFRTIECQSTDFSLYQRPWFHRTLAQLRRKAARLLGRAPATPHLYWIGARTS